MLDTNSHYLPDCAPLFSLSKTLTTPNPYLTASSIKGNAREMGRETIVTNARWMGALRSAKVPVSITIGSPSISSPAATFLCPHSVAECIQTCSLGTLSQWDTKVASSREKPLAVHKQRLWKVHLRCVWRVKKRKKMQDTILSNLCRQVI